MGIFHFVLTFLDLQYWKKRRLVYVISTGVNVADHDFILYLSVFYLASLFLIFIQWIFLDKFVLTSVTQNVVR